MQLSLNKSLVYGFGVALLALFVVGFIVGAIGSKFTDSNPFLKKPEVHLPPQLIYDPFTSDTHGDSHDDHSKESDGHGGHEKDGHHGEKDAHHGLPPNHFVITNTLISSWIATLILILVLVLGARGGRSDREPKGFYNIIESIISALYGFAEGVVGDNAKKFFPLFATIFLFVLVNAWLGLIPIYQSLSTFDSEGHITGHFLRPAGTDLNMPLALAIVSFIFVEYWGIKTLGFGYFGKFFRFGALLKGKIFEGIVDFFVGILELLSEFIRLVSFTFRLFGNMTAGEILLLMTSFLIPFAFSLPFYGLELLVGVIQSLIFSALTLVFVTMAIEPHHDEGEDH
ncbi:MAG: F0F1 ATP synthase subunit A [SAR202 cluster bacterium]|nr:F0F1 ATP synthase subunit A [SAR202 cluster bacterium]